MMPTGRRICLLSLVVVAGAMLSACSAADLSPTLATGTGASLDPAPYSVDQAGLAASEKPGPTTCTIKGTMVNCF